MSVVPVRTCYVGRMVYTVFDVIFVSCFVFGDAPFFFFFARATMELQIKTAMQMRDQGHALKQKALDLVSEAEQKVGV